MLASRSAAACMAVADARLEGSLSKVLQQSKDPHTQCWTLAILANAAAQPQSRERQAVAVPALCRLVQSKNPEVQHAAALHLATLSHSQRVQEAFGANSNALRVLHDIEKGASKTLCAPGTNTLKQEAQQYARWALRTAQGRHYKPHYHPKTDEEMEAEGAVAIQARVRSSFVANQYRSEMRARRAAATVVQAGFRGHKGRSDVAAELLVQGPAVAMLQGWVRGRAYRKEMAKQKAREQREMDLAAARIQGGYRGKKSRARPAQAAAGGDAATEEAETFAGLSLSLDCADGALTLNLNLDAPTDEDVMATLYIKCLPPGGGAGPVDFVAIELFH